MGPPGKSMPSVAKRAAPGRPTGGVARAAMASVLGKRACRRPRSRSSLRALSVSRVGLGCGTRALRGALGCRSHHPHAFFRAPVGNATTPFPCSSPNSTEIWPSNAAIRWSRFLKASMTSSRSSRIAAPISSPTMPLNVSSAASMRASARLSAHRCQSDHGSSPSALLDAAVAGSAPSPKALGRESL